MSAAPRDRREELYRSTALNGIDFVEIAETQTALIVHFFNEVVPSPAIDATQIRISGGERLTHVAVTSVGAFDQGALTLQVDGSGDFSNYTLTIDHPLLDAHYRSATFSFKALCETRLDCAVPVPECRHEATPAPPIDYLAKDFESFKNALLDFSALRYPAWQERSEADFGTMFLEALAAMGDQLSYLQDRVAGEARLDTATERRSLVRHARLVDYEPRPALVSRVFLRFVVEPSVEPNVDSNLALPSGLGVSAQGPDGQVIPFETGFGLAETNDEFPVRVAWNEITPYFWDDDESCLAAGATELWVLDPGHRFVSGPAALTGRRVLIETRSAEDPTLPPVRQLLRLTATVPERDAIFLTNGQPTEVTLLRWEPADALTRTFDLRRTTLAGNIVPATQGKTVTERFAIALAGVPEPATSDLPVALVRLGRGTPGTAASERFSWTTKSRPEFAYPLRQGPLAWRADPSGEDAPALPEVRLMQTGGLRLGEWTFLRWLLAADARDRAFTVDPIAYRALAPPRSDGVVFADYDGRGDTLRFGDGTFGALPASGSVFEVTYRVGGGPSGNVAADAINRADPALLGKYHVTSVTNPLPAVGGKAEESDESVRRRAPEAYRVNQPRAVHPRDYDVAAEGLDWVQRAGTSLRWTGSWTSVFTTVDPRGSVSLSDENARELANRLNRYRLAGHESFVLPPRFTALDLEFVICARPDAFQSDVYEAVLESLRPGRRRDQTLGFFDPDRLTFGQALERSELEAVVQGAQGVDGVRSISFRERGRSQEFLALPDVLAVAFDHIFCADNDPSRPERGSLKIQIVGGK